MGVKFALAGTLGLFLAEWIRLDQPEWVATTALVLSTPKYVGAIAEKMLFRIVGAIAGAIIGYTITASLEQEPILFLSAMGILVAVTTALYGGTLAPYGIRQAGYTATLVAAQGMADPDFSWKVGMARCEEVCLGILVATLVTMVLWPRYARVEFAQVTRSALSDLQRLFRERSEMFLKGTHSASREVLPIIGPQLSRLRKLIRIAAFESRGFYQRQPQINLVVSQLGTLATAISDLGRELPGASPIRPYVEQPAHQLQTAIENLFELLASEHSEPEIRDTAIAELRDAINVYSDALSKFRSTHTAHQLHPVQSFEHAGYWVSVREIATALDEIARVLPSLQDDIGEGFPTIRLKKFSLPSKEWVLNGTRAGIAVAVALVLMNWLSPPGGDMLVVGTYLITALSLVSPDGRGDLGVFDTVVKTGIICVGLLLFLLVAVPIMASYAVMNIVLGLAYFLLGYTAEVFKQSMTFSMIGLLTVASLVGINAQQPVPFPAILDIPMGILLATILSSLIRRLCWPVLPQAQLRNALFKLLQKVRKHSRLTLPPATSAERAEFSLTVADAAQGVSVLRGLSFHQTHHLDNLEAYIHCLGRIGGHVLGAPRSGVDQLPEDLRLQYRELCRATTSLLITQLDFQTLCLGGITPHNAPPPRHRELFARNVIFRRNVKARRIDVRDSVDLFGQNYRNFRAVEEASLSSQIAFRLPFNTLFEDRKL